MKATLTPYLNFNGHTSEAMKFYQSVLGGELKMQSYGESGQSAKPEEKDLIMHAELRNENLTFMASDAPTNMKVTMGTSVQLCISGSDEAVLTTYFNGLAEGGKVDMPLAKQFWGDTFGMLTDKFGIHWMINISANPQQ